MDLALLAPSTPRTLEVEDLVVDLDLQEVRRHGRPLSFTHQEFELLRFFVENRGRVFTRKELVTQVWGGRALVSLRTVDIHVYRLRAKLGAPLDVMIATVRRVGYKLCADRKIAESMTRPRRTPRLSALPSE
jgi:two-component system OmpR family response regulator